MRRSDKKDVRVQGTYNDAREIWGEAATMGRVTIRSTVRSGNRPTAYLGNPAVRRTVSGSEKYQNTK
jgi:hypothetical protein